MKVSLRDSGLIPALEENQSHFVFSAVANTSTAGIPHHLHRRLNTWFQRPFMIESMKPVGQGIVLQGNVNNYWVNVGIATPLLQLGGEVQGERVGAF